MFTQSAQFYDLIYSFKDYRKEAKQIDQLIHNYAPHTRSILDIGCGTAEHHRYLKNRYSIERIDINEVFVDIARRKNPECSYYQANMTDFALDKKYDVILCLFSSIGYVEDYAALVSTLNCFRQHLKPNGIVLVEPWLTPDTWYDGRLHLLTYEQEDLKICRMNKSETVDNKSVINFHYLIGTKADGVHHFEERHELILLTQKEMEEGLRAAGFHVKYEDQDLTGRGMYLGRPA